MSLFAELKRRNVIRMAGLYLVGAWLVVQVAETLLPIFETPGWVLKALVLLLAIGFVPTLVFSWVYELTPEGLKRDHEVDPQQSISLQTARRLDQLTLAALVVAMLLVLGDRFTREPAPTPAAAGLAPPAASAKPRLAVLPLANFSPDPDNAFFADGLHDDLLTALSRMQGVEVVSRTTMQTFKDSKLKLADIARDVGATQVLEGSVRRDGTRVRLTVQLIDARTDGHLWAETYDRALADALTLQNEVAKAVARAMKVALAQGADDAPPTAVPAAYDLYLKARLTTVTTDQFKLLDSALLLDPTFALARAARGDVACQVFWFDATKRATLLPQARQDIAQARAERPGLVAADIAEATCVYYGDMDYPRALGLIDRVLAVNANDVDALAVRSNLLRRLGRKDEALAAVRQMLTLDPANPNSIGQVVDKYTWYGLFREGIAAIDTVLPLLPAEEADRQRVNRARFVYYLTGDRAAWLAYIDSLQGKMPQPAWQELYYDSHDPSAASVKHLAGQDERLVVIAAVHADHLDDVASRDQLLARHDRLIAGSPARSGRVFDIALDAASHALRGDRAGAVAGVDAMFAHLEAKKDDADLSSALDASVFILARAGEKERALAMLERRLASSEVANADLYHFAIWRKLLGDEPRYQAAMKTISDRFEKL